MATQRNLGRVRGDDGVTPRIAFTTPVTLPPGSNASITNIGTDVNPVLRFGIPAGTPGTNGASGMDGRNGRDGDIGPEGPRGRAATIAIDSIEMIDEGADPEVINIGNQTDAQLVFKIPRPTGSATDEEFIEGSENPVQSKTIQAALAQKADSSSIPTKVSELENDRGFVSEAGLDAFVEDKVVEYASVAVPIDDELSSVSNNPVQNRVITEELGKKLEMQVEDLLDDTDTKYGERVTFSRDDKDLSIDLQGPEIITATLTKTIAGREPTIVAALPETGDETMLYLVPTGSDNYSMHIWMDIAGTMGYASVSGGNDFGKYLFNVPTEEIVISTPSDGRFMLSGVVISITSNRIMLRGNIGVVEGFDYSRNEQRALTRIQWSDIDGFEQAVGKFYSNYTGVGNVGRNALAHIYNVGGNMSNYFSPIVSITSGLIDVGVYCKQDISVLSSSSFSFNYVCM